MTLRDYAAAVFVLTVLYALLVLLVVAMDTLLATSADAAISSVLSLEQMADIRGAHCE